MKTLLHWFAVACLLAGSLAHAETNFRGKRVLHVASYHAGFVWTDAIERTMRTTAVQNGIEYQVFYMDTKNRATEPDKKAASLKAKALIDSFKPDVVIVSDDDAAKYLLMPYYRDSTLPFVFCGVNWDASVYGLPYKNTTGMVEVDLVNKVVEQMQTYRKGKRVGVLSADDITEHKNVDAFVNHLNLKLDKVYLVKTIAQWKDAFLKLQKEVDSVLLINNSAIAGWDDPDVINFIRKNARVPIGANLPWMMPYAMIGLTKMPEEQGEWAIKAAMDILRGTNPSAIPVVRNQRGKLYINLKIADAIGVVFSTATLKNAEIVP